MQELLADTTFRPRINAASGMAVSKLKVVSDPGNYIATVEVGPSARPCCSLLIITSSGILDAVGNVVGNVVKRCLLVVGWKLPVKFTEARKTEYCTTAVQQYDNIHVG